MKKKISILKSPRFGILFILILGLTLCIGCGNDSNDNEEWPEPAQNEAWPERTQKTVDAMASLTRSLRIPEHLYQAIQLNEEFVKTGEEFDVNEFFSVLEHLSMVPGYVLDYDYAYYKDLGFPHLYARESDKADSEYPDYMNYIRTDGTEDSFFELVVLRIMGGQFYLWWHANFDDLTIICNSDGLEDILTTPDEMDQTIPPEVQQEARELELEPSVEFENDTVTVQVVVFTKWGGFMQQTYAITRDFPHNMLRTEEEILVPYYCTWLY